MKIFIVSVLSVCFFVSCNTDDMLSNTNENNVNPHPGIVMKSLNSPANSTNSFDYVGDLQLDVLTAYVQNYSGSALLSYVVPNVNTTTANNSGFNTISTGYSGLNTTDAQWVVNNVSDLTKMMNKTTMSTGGKTQMSNFISMLEGFKNQAFANTYASITSFESTITGNSTLTSLDKQVTLSTTSTARYLIAYECNGGGRGWNKTKAGIMASINNDDAAAVTTSLMTNIVVQ